MKTKAKNILFLFDEFYFSKRDKYFPDYLIDATVESLLFIYGLGEFAFKGYQDTFKPYKAAYARNRDYLQPFVGLINILKGLGRLLLTPFMFAFDLLANIGFTIGNLLKPRESLVEKALTFLPFLAVTLIMTLALNLSRLAEGLAVTLQGATQLVTTPLTWLVKIPLRSLSTAIFGAPKIEDNRGMRELINRLQDNHSNNIMMHTYERIHQKFRKQRSLGQASEIINENSCFQELELSNRRFLNNPRNPADEDLNRQAKQAYHRLFLPRAAQLPPAYQEPVNQQEGRFNIGGY